MALIFLSVFIIACIIAGFHFIVHKNEYGIGAAAFVFAVLVFLYTLVSNSKETTVIEDEGPTKIANENTEPNSSSSTYSSTELPVYINETTQNSGNIPTMESSPSQDNVTKISGNSFSGYISANNQEDFYTYTPGISGIYRFDFDSDNANADYKFYILLPNGEQVASSYYSNGGKTVELDAGQTYSIIVKQYTEKVQYTIHIGIPNDIVTIDGAVIEGILSYSDQKDEYTYTAPITGQYRFDFSSSDVQCDYRFYIYASNNQQLVSTYFSNNGKTVELAEGDTYTLSVKQYSGYPSYTITIGIPNTVQVINGNSFSGSITYTGQIDNYTYFAPVTGKYRFDFISDNVQADYRFYLYASNNEQLASTYYSNKGKTVDLVEGETYRIEVKQNSGMENYTINIGVPNNIINAEGNTISGNLTFTDQENLYTYTAPVSGKYKFTFGTDDANSDYRFYVISAINEQIASSYYSNGSKVVQLEAGQVYTIKVKQYSAFPAYRIDIGVE